MTVGFVQLKIRLPRDIKVFLEAQANENSSSQNSEIIRAIRMAMKTKSSAGAPTPPSHDQNHPTQMDGGIDV